MQHSATMTGFALCLPVRLLLGMILALSDGDMRQNNIPSRRNSGKKAVSSMLRNTFEQDDERDINHDENDVFWQRLLENVGMMSVSVPNCGPPPAPTPVPACTPTTGACVSNFASLQTELDRAGPNSVVSLCGSNTITTPFAVRVTQSGIYLCCESENCIIESSTTSSDRNLVVTGQDFTMAKMDIRGGSTGEGRGGGNVKIISNGTHRILECRFERGQHQLSGGNLFIRTTGGVLVDKSRFAEGDAPGGGGVYVEDALDVVITSSEFFGNNATGTGGGGLLTTLTSPTSLTAGQRISIYKTSFEENTASFGGGYLATTIGQMPRLTIAESVFEQNMAFEGGAAGTFLYDDINTLDLSLCSNDGTENVAENECDDFLFYLKDAVNTRCITVTEDF